MATRRLILDYASPRAFGRDSPRPRGWDGLPMCLQAISLVLLELLLLAGFTAVLYVIHVA